MDRQRSPEGADHAASTARPSLLRSALEYSVGAGLGVVGSILRVGMTARLLSPDERGTWIALQLGFNYAVNFLPLGSCDGMLRAVPLLRGKGDFVGAAAAKRTTLSFMLATTAAGWLLLASFAALGRGMGHRPDVLLTGLLTTVTLLKSYYTSVYKGEARFRDLSISAAIGSVTSILTVGLIWVAGLSGLIWGMILQAGCELAWLVPRERPVGLGIDREVLRSLLQVGVLVLLTSLLGIFSGSVDRTVMLSRLGTAATGEYYIGANIIALLPVVAALPANVLTPRFFEVYGATSRGDALVPLVERSVRVGSVLLAALLGVGCLMIAPVVTVLWPGLVGGIDAATIAAIGTFPVVLFGLVAKVFYAMNRLVAEIALLGVGAAIGFACAHAAVTLVPTIAAAAAGSVVGLFATYALGTLVAYQAMVGSWRPGARLLVESLAPAVVAAVLVLSCRHIAAQLWPAASLVRAAASETCFVTLFAPWVVGTVRRLRVEPIR